MFCKECGNVLKENEQFCSKCGKKVKIEQENKIKNRKVPIIIVSSILIVILITGIVYFTCFNKSIKPEGIKQIGTKGSQVSQLSELSFSNMKSYNENLKLDETQKEILNYFDNDYFLSGVDYEYEDLQRYPIIFENSKLAMDFLIVKVLKSTADEFEAVIYVDMTEVPLTMKDIENGQYTNIAVLKSKQLKERLVEGDTGTLYGRYLGIETYEIDGKSYSIPVINNLKITKLMESSSLDTITTVAKYIFGNDIKIREAVYGVDSENGGYVITLDNQSNANFKQFSMSRGNITYTQEANGLTQDVDKMLYISADFQHYIVVTRDTKIKRVYIDYFDRNYTKKWSREFDYIEELLTYNIPMDYTTTQLAVTIDNDLYLINLESGEDLIEPVLVGQKIKVVMLSDSILLVGSKNKDTIMRVDYKGNIMQKINADSKMEQFTSANTQIVNGRLVIHLNSYIGSYSGYTGSGLYASYTTTSGSKYIVLNSDGTVELSTTDRTSKYEY